LSLVVCKPQLLVLVRGTATTADRNVHQNHQNLANMLAAEVILVLETCEDLILKHDLCVAILITIDAELESVRHT
jgi:hypothetical protein